MDCLTDWKRVVQKIFGKKQEKKEKLRFALKR